MKHLKRILKKQSGRNSSGKVTVRHQGGRVKRYFRLVDFKRDKVDVWGKVMTIEKQVSPWSILPMAKSAIF